MINKFWQFVNFNYRSTSLRYCLGFLCTTVFLMADASHATNYYIKRSTGQNSNGGIDTSAPWFSTLAFQGKIFLVPGDSLLFRRGEEFPMDPLFIARHIKLQATKAKPIVIGAWGSGNVRPRLTTNNGRLIVLENVANVTIENLSLSGARWGCIEMVDSLPRSIRVLNNELSGCGGGIYAGGTDIEIYKNTIHDMKMVVNTPGAPGSPQANDDYGASGIGLSQLNGCRVHENTLYNLFATSFDYGEDGGGFEFWRTVRNCDIFRNFVKHSDGFMEMGGTKGDSVVNVNIHHNISLESGEFACFHQFSPQTSYGISYRNLAVDHNLSLNKQVDPGFHIIVSGDTLKDPTQITVRNNIFASVKISSYVYQEGVSGGRRMPGTFQNNILWSPNNPGLKNYLQSPSEIFADPKFILSNWYVKDTLPNNLGFYKLSSSSPAIGSAVLLKIGTLVPTTYQRDFNWNLTVQNGRADIGPFSYIPPAPTALPTSNSTPTSLSISTSTTAKGVVSLMVSSDRQSVVDVSVFDPLGHLLLDLGTWSLPEGMSQRSVSIPERHLAAIVRFQEKGYPSRAFLLPSHP
ncbi:MAG: right-handed parallel beta-helix repeat-containing protein [Fibrobacteres bacterium]|nr:right-handed parallel beta-helix repeat-containing protein [Fibrobacterota bacterium]